MTLSRIIIIVLIILAILLGIVGFYFYQKNIFSKADVKLEILGLREAVLVKEIEYKVTYKNNGNIRLEDAKLIFEYPEASILEGIQSLRQKIEIGDIYPGEEKTLTFKARLMGKEGDAKEAKAKLTYRPKNLKAYYDSNTTHTALITRVPITFEFDFPSKTEAEREIKLGLTYYSSADYPLSNLRVKINYPSGFEFLESNIKGLSDDEWNIGLLDKNDGDTIEIKGKLIGEPPAQKIFKAQLIYWQDDRGIVLKETAKGVEIVNPSIFLSWQINGSPQYVANPGDYLHYEIFFKNIGDRALKDLFLVVSLNGEILDLDNLQSESGQLQGNIIAWDHTAISKLRLLPSMEEGRVEFWVKTKRDSISSLRKPVIKTNIKLAQIKEEIITKVNSKLIISQKGFFNQGPFENKGPIPPQVGSTTTYTIFWQARSLYNDLKDAKIRASLPSPVEFKGEFLPEDAKLSYDPASHEVVWYVGDLPASELDLEIQFQVAFTPNSSQREKTPDLISSARLTGDDNWTEATLTSEASAVNTTLPDDSTISEEDGRVK